MPAQRPMSASMESKCSKSDLVAEWLKGKAASSADFKLFASSHHRTLQNSEIVRVWKFAAEFHDSYWKSSHDMSVCC